MKNKIQSTKLLTVLCASCLATTFSPFSYAENRDKKEAEQLNSNSAVLNEMIREPLSLALGENTLNIENIRGTDVINKENKKLGEIEGFVFNSSNRTVTHLVISTDNWLDGLSAIVPVKGINHYSKESNAEPDPEVVAFWNDENVILNMDEVMFDELATFKKDDDLITYLEGNYEGIAETFGLEPEDVFDSGIPYDFKLGRNTRLGQYRSNSSNLK
jgi:sporulation protein YlmC with PRC-barrel domain|tara:strand:- start:31 stop:678 length:648 start_codon:yes stop_codon:yes gene_type:complete